jgi:peptide/nickel transport system substrate-binding protein
MNWKQRVTALVVLILAFALIGLPGTAQGQAVKNPDTLVIQPFGDASTLDPSFAYDTASSGAFEWTIYETLIYFSGTKTDQYVPLLATEVPSLQNGGISADGKTYTFKIRQGVKFHDGSTMTPADIKYSLLRFMLLDPPGGPAWILLSAILGLDIETTRDDNDKLIPDMWDRANRAIQVKGNNVVITLKDPFGPFLNIMAIWSIVVSKKFVVQNGGWDGAKATLAKYNGLANEDQYTLFNKASGTGPFKLQSWDPKTGTIVLERNDSYWRAPAKLRRIVIQSVQEFGPRRLALQNGDADYIVVDRADQPAVTGLPGVRVVDDLPVLATDAIFLQLAIRPEGNRNIGSGRLDGNGIPPNFFTDVHVRRGFAHLFDRDRFVREALRGKGTVSHGPIPKGVLGYNPKGQWYELSRDRAIAEFKEAWGGQVWERGFKFTLLYNAGNISRQTAAQMMKEAAESINPKFQIDVQGVPWATYLPQYRGRQLPMYVLGWIADFADPHNFAQPFMSSNGAFTGRQGYKNADADRLIEAAARETDAKKRAALYAQVEEIAFRDVPTIYLSHNVRFVVMRTWVKGWFHNPMFWTGYMPLYNWSKQ